jgi:hypothetical protein
MKDEFGRARSLPDKAYNYKPGDQGVDGMAVLKSTVKK